MPDYKVTTPRFHDGKLYEPGGKREVITFDKAFPKNKIPEGLVPVKEQTAAEKKAAEKKAKTDKKKAAEDKVEKDAVTFTEPPKASQPESL